MWTQANRGRMAIIEKKTKRYPSDLTDEKWARIAPLLPEPAKRGRKAAVDLREVLNAIRYTVRSGGGWRMLVPADLTVHESCQKLCPTPAPSRSGGSNFCRPEKPTGRGRCKFAPDAPNLQSALRA
jgi:hypothetical protein